MTFAVLPDLDAAIISFLTGHASLSPLHGGRVGTTLSGTSTQIRVTNLGGSQPWPWRGVAEFQLECWGGTQQQANTLARTVCAAIYDMRQQAVTGGRIVTAVPTLMPLWRPDDVTNRARYIVQVQLEATPE